MAVVYLKDGTIEDLELKSKAIEEYVAFLKGNSPRGHLSQITVGHAHRKLTALSFQDICGIVLGKFDEKVSHGQLVFRFRSGCRAELPVAVTDVEEDTIDLPPEQFFQWLGGNEKFSALTYHYGRFHFALDAREIVFAALS